MIEHFIPRLASTDNRISTYLTVAGFRQAVVQTAYTPETYKLAGSRTFDHYTLTWEADGTVFAIKVSDYNQDNWGIAYSGEFYIGEQLEYAWSHSQPSRHHWKKIVREVRRARKNPEDEVEDKTVEKIRNVRA